jgi:AcrR family transcriptional regulator
MTLAAAGATPALLHTSARPRRDDLLAAARRAMRDHGPNASMDQIAAAAGVTKPIIYRHVGGRSDLLAALTEAWVDDFVASSREVLAQQVDPYQATVALVGEYVTHAASHPAMYTAIVSDLTDLAAHRRRIDRIASTLIKVMEPALVASGRPKRVAVTMSHAIVGAVHYATDHWIAHNPDLGEPFARAELVDDVTQLVWSGIAPLYTPAQVPKAG